MAEDADIGTGTCQRDDAMRRRGSGRKPRLSTATQDPGTTPGVLPATWHLYLIECRDGSLYTGVAVDVAKRFRAHASGKGARYTRSHPPARLLATVACIDRGDALRAEHALKKLAPGAKRAFAARHPPAEPLEA